MEITVTPASDWSTTSEILMGVVQWFNARGTLVWTEDQVSAAALQSSYKIEESFIAYHDTEPIACMFLQESDLYYWPEILDDSSLFLHKLAVVRKFKGRGIAEQMLRWASDYAQREGKFWLRLDCHGGWPKVRQVYESFGFSLVDRGPIGEFEDVARYKLRV